MVVMWTNRLWQMNLKATLGMIFSPSMPTKQFQILLSYGSIEIYSM